MEIGNCKLPSFWQECIPVQHLDGRVDLVVGGALISLPDDGSHNIGERAAIIPIITAGDMASSGVAENMPKDFFPSRAGGWQWCLCECPLWLCCESLPVRLEEVSVGTSLPGWGGGMTREGDCYAEVVRPKDGEGEPHRIGKEMAAQKCDNWREGLTLRWEVGREILVHNYKLHMVNHPIEGLPSGRCPIIPFFWRTRRDGGRWSRQATSGFQALQKGVKVGGVVLGVGRHRGYIDINKDQCGGLGLGLDAAQSPPRQGGWRSIE